MNQAIVTIPPGHSVRTEIGRARGFTMIEMLMTIAIAAILMGLAIPSFRYITNANRIASELNGLLGDLQLARTEAIKDAGWYDLVHSHYWLSGQVGWLARDRWSVPLVHTAHTLAAVKNASAKPGSESNLTRAAW